MRSRFFQVASQFQGKISTVKGPASALRLYLRKIDWDIDARGFLLVSAFERLHLAHTSLQEILLQVNLAWQRDFTTLYTSRKLLKGLPDISRLDTSRVLRAFRSQTDASLSDRFAVFSSLKRRNRSGPLMRLPLDVASIAVAKTAMTPPHASLPQFCRCKDPICGFGK